jgi:hypothetical protein
MLARKGSEFSSVIVDGKKRKANGFGGVLIRGGGNKKNPTVLEHGRIEGPCGVESQPAGFAVQGLSVQLR